MGRDRTSSSTPRRSVEEIYGGASFDEEAVGRALGATLHPRGPEMLFDLVAGLGLRPGDRAIDLGCREARHSIELARRFGLVVLGVDPVERHLEGGRRALRELAKDEPELAARLSVERGVAGAIPAPDASVDLVWCRDVLIHVEDLIGGMRECHRVLRPGGHVLIYQMCATEWLDPAEAERLWFGVGAVPANTDPAHLESTFTSAGLRILERIELRSEWREWMEENGERSTGLQLLHAARLLRRPAHFIEVLGAVNYEVELANCLWGVYQMIGKLSPRVYVLRR